MFTAATQQLNFLNIHSFLSIEKTSIHYPSSSQQLFTSKNLPRANTTSTPPSLLSPRAIWKLKAEVAFDTQNTAPRKKVHGYWCPSKGGTTQLSRIAITGSLLLPVYWHRVTQAVERCLVSLNSPHYVINLVTYACQHRWGLGGFICTVYGCRSQVQALFLALAPAGGYVWL